MTDPSERYSPFLTAAEIYRQLTEGEGSRSLTDRHLLVRMEADEESDRANVIASIGDLIASGWQGGASAAARGAALPLKEHVMTNADMVDRVQDLMSRQVGSFERAFNSVRPVSGPPEMRLDEPFPFDADYAKEVAGYQADAQHNMTVFGQYDGASEYNETNMPQEFRSGGRDGGAVSVKSPDFIEVGNSAPRDSEPGSNGPGEFGGPGGGYPGGPSSGSHPSAAGPYPGGSPGGSPGAPSGGFQTDPNHYRPPSSYPPPGYSHPGPGQQGIPAASTGGFVGGGPVGGYSGGGGGGYGPRGGGGGGGSAPVVRGPGAAAGALAAEEAAARRAAQAAAGGRGGAGPMGAPLGGGGRGKGDEDAEHERKVLIEADSEDTFGSDVLTAPQVIGDDEYED